MKQILHVCSDGRKENAAQQVAAGFKFCPFCGEEYVSNKTKLRDDIIAIFKKNESKLLDGFAGHNDVNQTLLKMADEIVTKAFTWLS